MNKLHDFVEGSAKRHALFQHIQDPEKRTKTLQHLSDTRWACRDRAFSALVEGYSSVVLFLQIVDDNERGDVGSTANGLLASITKLEFIFFVHLLHVIFQETSILHKALQKKDLDLATALQLATLTKQNLCEYRDSQIEFYNLYQTVKQLYETFDNEEPITSAPSRKLTRTSTREQLTSSASSATSKRYHELYKATFSNFIEEIEARFKTENYEPLIHLSKLILAKKKEEVHTSIMALEKIYFKVVNLSDLENEIIFWINYKNNLKIESIKDVCNHFSTNASLENVFPNLFLIIKIYLSVPVSSAGAERSFSCLNLLKNCLRTTMNQERLSSLAVIKMNKDILPMVNLDTIIDKFAKMDRRSVFF